MESQVYSFVYDNLEYIIRINPNNEGFKKDKYAYEHFKNNLFPIPKIIEHGKFYKDYFCITEKANGITFEDSKEKVITYLLEDITNIWKSISNIDISSTTGY